MKLVLKFRRFLSDESGATAIEYAVIMALVALGIVTAAGNLGGGISSKFETAATSTANEAAEETGD